LEAPSTAAEFDVVRLEAWRNDLSCRRKKEERVAV